MVVVSYGIDIIKTTYEALSASDLSTYLEKDMSVSIKPNLVVPRPAYDGATTHPEVVEGIVLFLRNFGISDIKIIESSWIGDSTRQSFDVCGYVELSQKLGIPLIDLKSDKKTMLTYGKTNVAICNEALKTDFLINAPVLKAHSQTYFTCCLKNLKGCIPDSEKRRFHTLDLHQQIAILNMLLKTGYCVVDGICGDLTSEAGGQPVESNRIIVGRDPLIVDSYCAELIGCKPDDIGYLYEAKALGFGEYFSSSTKLTELNVDNKPTQTSPASRRTTDQYRQHISEDSACSACFSSLIYALSKMGKYRSNEMIHIGQGYKGVNKKGIGIGNCTKGFEHCIQGCPPKATEIIDTLNTLFPIEAGC